MRFLQVHTFYPQYLNNLYRDIPDLADAEFFKQLEYLVKDGFGGGHVFPPYLTQFGYETQLVIANNHAKQSRWLYENGIQLKRPQNWFYETVCHQIEKFQPNILYLSDPILFDSKFLRCLSWKPDLVVGWRAAPVAETTDWSSFDLLLSSCSACLKIAERLGAKSYKYFFPGFPGFIASAVADQTIDWDVIFSGQWSTLHTRRNSYLRAVSKAPLLGQGDFSIGYFLTAEPSDLPAGISMHNKGPRWGSKMYRALRSGKICLNASIDMANMEAPNMRLFEATGVGAFLLNEAQSKLNNFFDVGTEIDTFSSDSELIEKINYYLDHPQERKSMAKRAHNRCLNEYSMKQRAAALDNIIQSHTRDSVSAIQFSHSDSVTHSVLDIKKLQQAIVHAPEKSCAYASLSAALQEVGDKEAALRARWKGWQLQWGDRDYVSPGLMLVNADAYFPNLSLGERAPIAWPYLRKEVPHNWYVDRRNPNVGFLSRDEAHLLHNIALEFVGKPVLEIGCWMGWSACHLALAGVPLDVIDPLLSNPQVHQTVSDSLTAAGVRANVNLVPGYSPQAVQELAAQKQQPWSLIFIDGNHDRPAPLEDTKTCINYAAPDAAIVFHDLASPEVAEGLEFLRQQGWNTMVYQTMQVMGIAWRGNVNPVRHIPDPRVNWTVPDHLKTFAISGVSDSAMQGGGLQEFQSWLEVIRPYTFLSEARLFSLYRLTKEICLRDIPGNFVECGTCKGGAAALMAATIARYSQRPRKLYAFDTFEGMPDPTDVDRANGVPANDTGFGSGTLGAPIDSNLNVVCRALNVSDTVVPVKGLFKDTLPQQRSIIGPIAFLHADGDWYESTIDIFQNLYGQIQPGGSIQIDDYGHWEGCRKAIDDLQSRWNVRFDLKPIDYTGVWFEKDSAATPR